MSKLSTLLTSININNSSIITVNSSQDPLLVSMAGSLTLQLLQLTCQDMVHPLA